MPRVVVTIPARSAQNYEELVATILTTLGDDVLVELSLDKEPSLFFTSENRLLLGFSALRAHFGESAVRYFVQPGA